MNLIQKTAAAALLAAPLVFATGCNSLLGGGNGAQSSAASAEDDVNPELKRDSPQFFSKSGAAGCATGALAGVFACLLSNSKNKAACAVAAGVGGCAVGMTANYLLDKVRTDYHNTEDQLNATQAAVQENMDKTAKLRDLSAKTLREDQAAVKQLNSDYEKGQATADQLKAKDKQLVANIKFLSEKKTEAEAKLKEVETARDGIVNDAGGQDSLTASSLREVKELNKKIEESKANIDALNDNILAYSQARDSLAVKNDNA
ncbi:MAG: hypothetical protein ACI4NA_09130 [Succinivibrio sp.]